MAVAAPGAPPEAGTLPVAPVAAARALIETRSIDYVPLAERHGKVWHLWPIWFCGDANLLTLSVGVIGLAAGTSVFWTALAVVLGCAFGTFFMAGHSAQGPQMGLPQLIQSRPQFGYTGALLVYLVAIVTYVGYNAFNQVLAGQVFHQLFGLPKIPSALAFSLVSIALAVAGYNAFHKIQRYVAYILIVALAAYTIGVAARSGHFTAAQLTLGPFRTTPFLAEFFAAAAYQLSWAIYVSDYSRYLPRDVSVAASFWWTYLGAFIGGAWMMLVGTAAAVLAPGANMAQALYQAGDLMLPGFGPVILAIAVLGLVMTAAQNYYGASLTLLSIVDTLHPLKVRLGHRIAAMIAVGLSAMGLALSQSDNFIDGVTDFLTVLLYLFTPWTAVNLVDFYVVRHGHFSIVEIFKRDGIYGRWNWRGIAAYLGGFVAMIPFFSTSLYTGPVARALDGADIAMVVGLIVSSAIYLGLCRTQDIAGELAQIPALDRELDTAT